MKKVLIITYYWPPSGGGGVQRWLKFAKYLPEFGWEPIIFTPENPDFEITDESLLAEVSDNIQVIKRPIWEPFAIYNFFFKGKSARTQGVVSTMNRSFAQKFMLWVRGNIFVPDPRIFWVKPSIKYLKAYLSKNKIDLIITTGPPHSCHLIGLGLKKSIDIKWIADFRDPWSDWDIHNLLMVSNRTKKRIQNLERSVIEASDHCLTVGPRLAKKLEEKSQKTRVGVVMNGFDESDYAGLEQSPTNKFRISHLGLLNEGRNPSKLWEVLAELCSENKEFEKALEIELAGVIEGSVIVDIRSNSALNKKVKILGYLTHEQVLQQYSKTSLLLLLVNKTDNAPWIVTGKIFECIRSLVPILALGPLESDANDILKNVGRKQFVSFDDKNEIKRRVLEVYESSFSNAAEGAFEIIAKYSRRNLTQELALICDEVAQ